MNSQRTYTDAELKEITNDLALENTETLFQTCKLILDNAIPPTKGTKLFSASKTTFATLVSAVSELDHQITNLLQQFQINDPRARASLYFDIFNNYYSRNDQFHLNKPIQVEAENIISVVQEAVNAVNQATDELDEKASPTKPHNLEEVDEAYLKNLKTALNNIFYALNLKAEPSEAARRTVENSFAAMETARKKDWAPPLAPTAQDEAKSKMIKLAKT